MYCPWTLGRRLRVWKGCHPLMWHFSLQPTPGPPLGGFSWTKQACRVLEQLLKPSLGDSSHLGQGLMQAWEMTWRQERHASLLCRSWVRRWNMDARPHGRQFKHRNAKGGTWHTGLNCHFGGMHTNNSSRCLLIRSRALGSGLSWSQFSFRQSFCGGPLSFACLA